MTLYSAIKLAIESGAHWHPAIILALGFGLWPDMDPVYPEPANRSRGPVGHTLLDPLPVVCSHHLACHAVIGHHIQTQYSMMMNILIMHF